MALDKFLPTDENPKSNFSVRFRTFHTELHKPFAREQNCTRRHSRSLHGISRSLVMTAATPRRPLLPPAASFFVLLPLRVPLPVLAVVIIVIVSIVGLGLRRDRLRWWRLLHRRAGVG